MSKPVVPEFGEGSEAKDSLRLIEDDLSGSTTIMDVDNGELPPNVEIAATGDVIAAPTMEGMEKPGGREVAFNDTEISTRQGEIDLSLNINPSLPLESSALHSRSDEGSGSSPPPPNSMLQLLDYGDEMSDVEDGTDTVGLPATQASDVDDTMDTSGPPNSDGIFAMINADVYEDGDSSPERGATKVDAVAGDVEERARAIELEAIKGAGLGGGLTPVSAASQDIHMEDVTGATDDASLVEDTNLATKPGTPIDSLESKADGGESASESDVEEPEELKPRPRPDYTGLAAQPASGRPSKKRKVGPADVTEISREEFEESQRRLARQQGDWAKRVLFSNALMFPSLTLGPQETDGFEGPKELEDQARG